MRLISALMLSMLVAIPAAALSKTLKCSIDPGTTGPTYLEFNTETRSAEILYPGVIGLLHGHVIRVSKSANGTDAYNFNFTKLPQRWVGVDTEWEFLLHRNSGNFVLLGVGYTVVDGKRYMSSTLGEHSARCLAE